MYSSCTKEVFSLQSEFIDMKVNASVNKAIDRVVEQMGAIRNEIHDLRHDMDAKFHDMYSKFHDLRHEMVQGFASLDKRIVAVETRLGIVGAIRKGFYDRFMDYLFKGSYAALYALVGFLAYLAYNFHSVIK